MPRIRTLKPEIWDSADFMSLTPAGQLAFIALITKADDEGRLQTNARHLQQSCLRNLSQRAVGAGLDALEQRRMIRRYEAEGKSYVVLVAWSEHQRVQHPSPSRIPDPPESSREGSGKFMSPHEPPRTRVRTGSDQTLPEQTVPTGPELASPVRAREEAATGNGNGESVRSENPITDVTAETAAIARAYHEISGRELTPRDWVAAADFDVALVQSGRMTVPQIADRLRSLWAVVAHKPSWLGGCWGSLRHEADHIADTQPPSRSTGKGGMTDIGSVLGGT